MIDVEDLTVSLGETTVLEGIDCHVEPGEFVGLVGPNGAGKTTLLRTINGSLTPDSGTVTLDGRALASLSARETSRRVATVHQDTSVQFAFDVETIVAMGRTPHRSRFGGDPEGGESVQDALERTDVDHLRDRRISEVSGGERQRVFLARALAQDAPALLLDEPTASLDVNHAARTLSLVRHLVDDGKAALGAIHDLDAAARYCDRLLLLDEGQVVASGPPTSVLTEDSIEAAFDVRSIVTTNPATGSPSVTALPTPADEGKRVHVLGGGPLAATAIGDLWASGHVVSAGPVPAGDVAAVVADSLGIEILTVPPFEPIGDRARTRARNFVEAAAVTVLAAPQLRSRSPLLALANRSEAIVLVDDESLVEREFDDIDSKRRYRRLRERSTIVGKSDVCEGVVATKRTEPSVKPQ